MSNFRVLWSIDIEDVESHVEAAEKALAIQRDSDPSNLATVFEVYRVDRRGRSLAIIDPKTVDLSEHKLLFTPKERTAAQIVEQLCSVISNETNGDADVHLTTNMRDALTIKLRELLPDEKGE